MQVGVVDRFDLVLVVRYVLIRRQKTMLGEPDGTRTLRVRRLHGVLSGAGFPITISTLDVNGDDMLAWWDADEQTTAAVLYLESLGRPWQFVRLARRLAAIKPVVTVRSGSSAAARRLPRRTRQGR